MGESPQLPLFGADGSWLVGGELLLQCIQRRTFCRCDFYHSFCLATVDITFHGIHDYCHSRRLGSARLSRLRFPFLQELLAVQQWSPQRWVVAGPWCLEIAVPLELRAHAFHLRIEIIEIVQHERLGEHGKLRRTELVLPVVAD